MQESKEARYNFLFNEKQQYLILLGIVCLVHYRVFGRFDLSYSSMVKDIIPKIEDIDKKILELTFSKPV